MSTQANDWMNLPTSDGGNLLAAAEAVQRELAATLSGDARFRALLCAGAFATAGREARVGDRVARLGARLPADRAAIRSGAHDDDAALFGALLAHVALRAWIADPAVPSEAELRHVHGSLR